MLQAPSVKNLWFIYGVNYNTELCGHYKIVCFFFLFFFLFFVHLIFFFIRMAKKLKRGM